MPKENDDTGIFMEIVQRLTKISSIARNALSKSVENARDVEEIKENQKWTWRTIAGIGVTFIIYFITKVIER